METQVISFYDKFECLNSECPNTCCRGWRISLDEETIKRYKEEPGIYGKKLRASMTFGEEKDVRKFFGRCLNETKEGLCRLQLNGRTDLMPEVCRVYPRRSVLIGDREEVTFELSCPKTAEIFLKNLDKPTFVDYDGEDIIPVWIEDVFDKKLFDEILIIREQVIDYIYDIESFPEMFFNLYLYYRYIHKSIMAGDDEITTIFEFTKELDSRDKWYFYSLAIFDKIIMNDLDDGYSFRRNSLSDFCRKYNKIFGKMTAEDADYFFHKKCEEMVEKYPYFVDKYKAYLAYYIQQTLYSGYEACLFLNDYLLGMVYLQMLIMTDVVDYVNGEDMLSVVRQRDNINKCEKRLRHNVKVKKNISKRVDTEFTKTKEGFLF